MLLFAYGVSFCESISVITDSAYVLKASVSQRETSVEFIGTVFLG